MEPEIFFASRLPELLELRQWAYAYGGGRVWVSERSAGYLEERLKRDPDFVRVACLRQVQASRHLICVFNGAYGSVIATEKVVSLGLEVSLLELELITAVLTRVPVVVLMLGELPKDARTQDLWAILAEQDTVRIDPKVYSMENIKERLKALIDEKLGRAPLPNRFMTRVSQHRLTRKPSPVSRPDINFLSNVQGFPKRPEVGLIEELTGKIGAEANQYDKLALLWMALRHCTPLDTRAPREHLVAMANALSGWVGAASWAGLHGHSYVGALAALHSIKAISIALGGTVSQDRETVLSSVDGGIASQYYSSAKLMTNARDRRVLLHRAADAVQSAIDNGQSLDRVLPIKASVLAAMGRREEALVAFDEVLRLRRNSANPNLAAIGEAEADLGWGHFLTRDVSKAYELLEKGTNTLRDSGNVPFTVKQLRKFAIVAATRNPRRGWKVLTEAHDLTITHGLTDQMRQMESLPVLGLLLQRRREKR